jgi:hypothetical protein
MPASAQHASGGVGERDGKRMRKQQLHSIHTQHNETTKKTGSRAYAHHRPQSDKPKTEKTKKSRNPSFFQLCMRTEPPFILVVSHVKKGNNNKVFMCRVCVVCATR